MPTAAQLNYVRTGPRGHAPVVLLHSAGLDLTYWDQQIADLSRRHDVIALDLPGHGRSITQPESITITQMSAAVITALDALQCGPVHLVGLSVGGLIAQQIALTDPQLITSLALLDTAARFAPDGQASMRKRAAVVREHGMEAILDGLFGHWLLPGTRQRRPDLIDRATKTLVRDDAGVQAALWETIADFDDADRLGSIAVPTLVLVGEHDSSSPVSSARELCAGIQHAQMRVIADAAHLTPIEQPTIVTGHLDAFVRSLSTVGTSS